MKEASTETLDFTQLLPWEVCSEYVFARLTLQELRTCSNVCRRWRALLLSNEHWLRVYLDTFDCFGYLRSLLALRRRTRLHYRLDCLSALATNQDTRAHKSGSCSSSGSGEFALLRSSSPPPNAAPLPEHDKSLGSNSSSSSSNNSHRSATNSTKMTAYQESQFPPFTPHPALQLTWRTLLSESTLPSMQIERASDDVCKWQWDRGSLLRVLHAMTSSTSAATSGGANAPATAATAVNSSGSTSPALSPISSDDESDESSGEQQLRRWCASSDTVLDDNALLPPIVIAAEPCSSPAASCDEHQQHHTTSSTSAASGEPDGALRRISLHKLRMERRWFGGKTHRAMGRLVTLHESSLNTMSLLGDTLITGSDDGTLRVHELRKSRVRRTSRTLVGHQSLVWNVITDSRGQVAISVSLDGTMRFWKIETGECLHKNFHRHFSSTWSQELVEQHKILTASSDRTARVWDIETSECLRVFSGFRDHVHSACYNPELQVVVAGARDRQLRIFDIRSRMEEACISSFMESSDICDVKCSGDLIVAGLHSGDILLYDQRRLLTQGCRVNDSDSATRAAHNASRPMPLARFKHPRAANDLSNSIRSLACDSSKLVSISTSNVVAVWDLRHHATYGIRPAPSSVPTEASKLSPAWCYPGLPGAYSVALDDRYLCVGSRKGQLQLWNFDDSGGRNWSDETRRQRSRAGDSRCIVS